ncbi:PD-(D/E)XK nuclease domain-containing protein [Synechocystis salina]|uniref:PD-(D/E)XK nuclease domain-containing protein n=1 Tax=Synechocystis salina TaxID=945780 RepID=UPI002240DAF1|nr:hypothetical protein [Synechocystis salina]
MTNPKIIILQQKKDELNKILENYSQWSEVEIWIAGMAPIIKVEFSEYFEEFDKYSKVPRWTALPRVVSRSRPSWIEGNYGDYSTRTSTSNNKANAIEKDNNKKKGQDAIRQLLNFLDTLIQLSSNKLTFDNGDSEDVLKILKRIFSRFHRINLQLQDRHDSRETIKIDDEYDVQDLLHALLTLYFDDIRPEEFTNSSAGSNSRTDFLLKREKVMIEAKKHVKDSKISS